jgi:carbamoyl-phosphate synthase small subunit
MKAQLVLEDGSILEGEHFGAPISAAGEVVFNTGMVGYAEAMTDPSYLGQILVFTYPLIGNYGIPVNGNHRKFPVLDRISPLFESNSIHVKGIVVSGLSRTFSHWAAAESLDSWMREHNVPGITGLDTRAITKRLRENGSMLGKVTVADGEVEWDDPNKRNLVAEISIPEPQTFAGSGQSTVVLVDFGCKNNILRNLIARGLTVLRVPWNYDWSNEEIDGVVLSNGPGDPKMCSESIAILRKGLDKGIPILGICLGHQLLGLAAGGDTYKLKYGHRGQNQPCVEVGSKRCFITSQNHGFAVNEDSLNSEWKPSFFNANDGTNEGLQHVQKPIFSIQFHPEASPGPVDTEFLFNTFTKAVQHVK